MDVTARRTFSGRCKRFMVRWSGQFLVAFFATFGAFAFTIARGVLATPARVDHLVVQVDSLTTQLGRVLGRVQLNSARLDSLHREQSVTNAFACFALPERIFKGSLIPCGEAFIASRIDPSIWRRVTP